VELDDGFDADNPYHSVALIYAGFLCERCGEYSSGGAGEQTPYRVAAEEVRRAGWLVKDRDPARYDYSVRCPACAAGRPG
jgi:hypothetical protein